MLESSLQSGVSLIELLIAVLILGVLSSIAAPAFTQWIQNSQIKNAAGSIQEGLQLARVEAVRRNQSVQFVAGEGASWTVGCVNSGGNCPGIIENRDGSEGSSNVAVAADETTIVFNGLGRITPAPAADLNFNITNPTGGSCASSSGPMRCLRVEVGIGGTVRMCDPALPGTDPKGC